MATTPSRAKKRVAIALAAALTLTGAGAAFAYWTSTGTGTGTATTGESVEFTIASDPAVGTIAPGNAGQTVSFTVTNPGTGSQNLDSVLVTIADADGDAWVPADGCSLDDYTAEVTTEPDYGQIAAGGTLTGVVTVKLLNTAANQDACQGQPVPLYFVAS